MKFQELEAHVYNEAGALRRGLEKMAGWAQQPAPNAESSWGSIFKFLAGSIAKGALQPAVQKKLDEFAKALKNVKSNMALAPISVSDVQFDKAKQKGYFTADFSKIPGNDPDSIMAFLKTGNIDPSTPEPLGSKLQRAGKSYKQLLNVAKQLKYRFDAPVVRGSVASVYFDFGPDQDELLAHQEAQGVSTRRSVANVEERASMTAQELLDALDSGQIGLNDLIKSEIEKIGKQLRVAAANDKKQVFKAILAAKHAQKTTPEQLVIIAGDLDAGSMEHLPAQTLAAAVEKMGGKVESLEPKDLAAQLESLTKKKTAVPLSEIEGLDANGIIDKLAGIEDINEFMGITKLVDGNTRDEIFNSPDRADKWGLSKAVPSARDYARGEWAYQLLKTNKLNPQAISRNEMLYTWGKLNQEREGNPNWDNLRDRSNEKLVREDLIKYMRSKGVMKPTKAGMKKADEKTMKFIMRVADPMLDKIPQYERASIVDKAINAYLREKKANYITQAAFDIDAFDRNLMDVRAEFEGRKKKQA